MTPFPDSTHCYPLVLFVSQVRGELYVRYKVVPPQLEASISPEKPLRDDKANRPKSKVRERLEQQAALRRGGGGGDDAGATAAERKEFLKANSRSRRIPLPKTKIDYSTVPSKTNSKLRVSR
jgi:hypothetical protein